MHEQRTYRLAGTRNSTLYVNGTWPSHDQAIDAARRCLDGWPHESWVRVKRHEGDRHWSCVAIVYRHRVAQP